MKRLFDPAHIHVETIRQLLESSFPVEERRPFPDFLRLLSNGAFSLYVWEENEKLMAFSVVWDFGDFQFLEYLAVHPDTRGTGYGTKAMNDLITAFHTPLLLEVEPPADAISRKRIVFYERLGFVLNDFPYFQPPYRADGTPFSLRIMSYRRPLEAADFAEKAEKLKWEVYERWYDGVK